jgi:hypothetical protein
MVIFPPVIGGTQIDGAHNFNVAQSAKGNVIEGECHVKLEKCLWGLANTVVFRQGRN